MTVRPTLWQVRERFNVFSICCGEELLQLLGRTFDVNLTALNGEYHWPTKRPFWIRIAIPTGRDYFPITVGDIAAWIRAGEFHYEYATRRAVPHPKTV